MSGAAVSVQFPQNRNEPIRFIRQRMKTVSARSSILRGGSLLAAGQVASQASSFIRNVIIARIISPADFGIAATFATTLSLMEMISYLAGEKLLVQSPDGDDPRLED